MPLSSTYQTQIFRVQPPHSTEPMAGTVHSPILTVFPATTSSFRRRHSLFLDSHSLPSAAKPLTFRFAACVGRRQKLLLVRACDRSQQISSDGNKETKRLSWVQTILRFARSNTLPLALVSAVALGLAYPSLGCAADKYSVSKVGPFGIFVISGLMLRSEEIGAAVEAWPVGLFGLVSILFLTPYFSRLLLQIQLQPQEFITGLAIFSCMPTTLASGVALTQLAGGNSALALAMTVISNMLGILIEFDVKEQERITSDILDFAEKLKVVGRGSYNEMKGNYQKWIRHKLNPKAISRRKEYLNLVRSTLTV